MRGAISRGYIERETEGMPAHAREYSPSVVMNHGPLRGHQGCRSGPAPTIATLKPDTACLKLCGARMSPGWGQDDVKNTFPI